MIITTDSLPISCLAIISPRNLLGRGWNGEAPNQDVQTPAVRVLGCLSPMWGSLWEKQALLEAVVMTDTCWTFLYFLGSISIHVTQLSLAKAQEQAGMVAQVVQDSFVPCPPTLSSQSTWEVSGGAPGKANFSFHLYKCETRCWRNSWCSMENGRVTWKNPDRHLELPFSLKPL